MKKLIVFFVLTGFCLVSRSQDSGWSAVLNVGVNKPDFKHKTAAFGQFEESSNDRYYKSLLSVSAGAGARYCLLNFYAQASVEYAGLKRDYLMPAGDPNDPALQDHDDKFGILSVPLIFGYHYKNRSKFYPLAEIGAVANYIVSSELSGGFGTPLKLKKFYPSFTGKAGFGYSPGLISFELKGSYSTRVHLSKDESIRYSCDLTGVQVSIVYGF
jgi:hypothetical protein